MLRDVLATIGSLWLLLGSTLGSCVPSATPDPVASKTARAEIAAFESFLKEPLCESIAVKYQLASDYVIAGDYQKTIALAAEVAQADQGFDFPLDREFKPLAACPEFVKIADSIHASPARTAGSDQLVSHPSLKSGARGCALLVENLGTNCAGNLGYQW